MQFVRHEAALDRPIKVGGSARPVVAREHWRDRLRSFDPKVRAVAEAKLDGPPIPAEVEYLHGWSRALHGRSGVGMSGVAPLSYQTIEAWARLTDTRIAPHEVEALIALDAVRISASQAEPERERPD